MGKCLTIGSTVCDITIYIDQLPTREGDIHLKKQHLSLGGCAYNVTAMLHHFSGDYTFISPVGTGIYGEFVLQELAKTGIQTEIRSQEANGCCYCLVESDGERTFMSYHGAEYTFDPAWVAPLDLNAYDYLYLCGIEVEDVDGAKMVAVLDQFEGQVFFCPGPRCTKIPKDRLEAIYRQHPIVHLNDSEILALEEATTLQEALVSLYRKTQNTIVVTMGAQGSLYYNGTSHVIAGFPANVVDTIGAGDSHAGAVLAALSQGANWQVALRFANLVASHVVSVPGVHLKEDTIGILKEKLHKLLTSAQ